LSQLFWAFLTVVLQVSCNTTIAWQAHDNPAAFYGWVDN